VTVGAAAVSAAAASTLSNTGHGVDHGSAVTGSSSATLPMPPTVPGSTGVSPSKAVPHLPPATRQAPSPAAGTATSTGTPGAPSSGGVFSLVVTTRSGEISTNVAALSVASNQPVDPPHATPEQWNTAVWVKQSSFPSARSDGTSYVYGHACHHHVCSFTNLKDASVDDLVSVTTPSDTLTYRIQRIGLSPKAASSLPSWASDSTVPNRLVLVTCAYEQGDTSTDNLVVVAQLQPA
jgi:Sortase domain